MKNEINATKGRLTQQMRWALVGMEREGAWWFTASQQALADRLIASGYATSASYDRALNITTKGREALL